MCGILGGNNFNDIQEVKNGLASIMHRGTDGNVIFHFEKSDFYMSHNRLSIQDLSESANQPLISENEKFVSQIVYEDLGECVRMYTIIDWQDPITNEPIERKNVELFILDQGGEM